MTDLALRQEQGPITLTGISQRRKTSLSYLEQLSGKLRRHEIVESVRGPGGGYSLARRVDDVAVADIAIVVDEPLDTTQCGGKGNYGDEGRVGDHTGCCMTHDLWAILNQKMVEYLDLVLLQSLVDQQRRRQPEVIRGMCEACPARHERTLTRARAVSMPAITSVAAEPVKRTSLANSVFSLTQS